MGDAPEEAQDYERKDRDPKGNMERHRIAGFHPVVDVRHKPAERELDDQKRHDEPVEYLRGGPVLQVLGHEVFLRGLAESLGEVAKRKGA